MCAGAFAHTRIIINISKIIIVVIISITIAIILKHATHLSNQQHAHTRTHEHTRIHPYTLNCYMMQQRRGWRVVTCHHWSGHVDEYDCDLDGSV